MWRKKMIADSCKTVGRVAAVRRCRWLRAGARLVSVQAPGEAEFPHIVTYVYEVDGTEYRKKKFVGWRVRSPRVGDAVTVYYDTAKPSRHGIEL